MHARLRRALGAVGWWEVLASPGPTRLLALNSLVDAAGTGLAAVCLPFYAVRVAHLSGIQLGEVLSAAGVFELLAAVPNGVLAGRIGVRRFTIAAKLVQAGAYAGLAAVVGLLPILLLAVVTAAARAGSSGLGQSLTVAVLGEDERAATLGAVRALRNIGYLLSGALGALALGLGGDTALRLALLGNAASFLIGAVWVARLRVLRPGEPPERTDWSVLRDAEYLGLIACAAVFGSSLVVLDVGLPLWVLRHPTIPAWTTACFVVVNTLLVVLLQVRFSRLAGTVRSATKAIRLSAFAFLGAALLLALTPRASAAAAVALLACTAVALTLGELLESPSWWTVSFELAPAGRRNEYLAAFDLSWALVAIAGPAAMAGIVALGSAGWVLYGLVLLLAAAGGTVLIRRRAGHPAGTEENPSVDVTGVTQI